MGDDVSPASVRTGIAILVTHAAQVRRRGRSPKCFEIRSHATARRAEVRFRNEPALVFEYQAGGFVGGAGGGGKRRGEFETLAMRGAAKVVAFAFVASEILECVSANAPSSSI